MDDNGFGAFLKCRWIKHLVQTIEMKSELICFTIRYEFVATCAERSRSKQTNSVTKPNVMINNNLHNSVIGSPHPKFLGIMRR